MAHSGGPSGGLIPGEATETLPKGAQNGVPGAGTPDLGSEGPDPGSGVPCFTYKCSEFTGIPWDLGSGGPEPGSQGPQPL